MAVPRTIRKHRSGLPPWWWGSGGITELLGMADLPPLTPDSLAAELTRVRKLPLDYKTWKSIAKDFVKEPTEADIDAVHDMALNLPAFKDVVQRLKPGYDKMIERRAQTDAPLTAVDMRIQAAREHVLMQTSRDDILKAYPGERAGGMEDMVKKLGFPPDDPVVVLGLLAVKHPYVLRWALTAGQGPAAEQPPAVPPPVYSPEQQRFWNAYTRSSNEKDRVATEDIYKLLWPSAAPWDRATAGPGGKKVKDFLTEHAIIDVKALKCSFRRDNESGIQGFKGLKRKAPE